VVVRTSAARLRLVRRLERSRPGVVFPRKWRMWRWVARRSRQWKPGSGIHFGLLAFPGRDAPGAEHGDQLPGADRRRRFMSAPPSIAHSVHLTRAPTILRPDPSRVLLRPFSPGGSQRTGRDRK